MVMKKLTPVLIVDRIENSLPFWCDRLGFTRQAEVPHGDTLGFVILTSGPVEVMLQSRASVKDDVPALAAESYRSALFIEVADLAPLRTATRGLPTLFEERTTPYGAREIGVRDPEGNAILFAQFGEPG
jgi:uncharacterized glyoxalase superfamily protein PhnB